MKICIIGGVAGGATAAARLRRLDERAEIVMLEKGDYISFANCGLPYHVSGRIKERKDLLLQTPESFWRRYRVQVRVKHEAIAIDTGQKLVRAINLSTGEEYTESYDFLILAPGASPFVPPIEGSDAAMFKRLHNLPDMDAIIAHIQRHSVEEAVVIGGGFIGVEIAENLVELGIKTHLVEMLNQVMIPFDFEMANVIHARLTAKGVCLHLSDSVTKVVGDQSGKVILQSGTELPAGLVVSAVGVRPAVKLAQEAGLTIGVTGGIVTNERMQTSDPYIFAVGDAVETTNFVSGQQGIVPLAGPANKQGRIAGNSICDCASGVAATHSGRYVRPLGTAIVKVFDLQAAATGLNEKTARKNNIPYQAIHLHPLSHAGYYPDAAMLTLKVLFSLPDGKVLGAQCLGNDGADKRIDVLATAIRAGMTVYDLTELELSYAPPFGSAKDPINMAGFMGTNILQKLVRSLTWDQTAAIENPYWLDVRTKEEFQAGSIPFAVNIPVDELRERISEVPPNRHIIAFCRVGFRAYLACRILQQLGFREVSNLSGGYLTYGHYAGAPTGR